MCAGSPALRTSGPMAFVPVKIHEPDNIRARIQDVESACPHALSMNIIRQIEQDRNLRPGRFTLDGVEQRGLARNFTGDMRALHRMVEIIVDQQVRHWLKC
ncbi:hypothetical protein LU298_03580 [Komagataeibacter intermedius]|nr:hypothetical protein [Komagataeibacter intermedius]MCF3635583.1 hypothetical protein [Komagataeibacter intermedius]GAN88736.1 hypothetical protein Gain_0600_023 [Komagataeibacter intermedius TF2]GBQ78986.1 hypothetical protein AA0521_3325 [Komagataeibacter intermedius NRIC 0521]